MHTAQTGGRISAKKRKNNLINLIYRKKRHALITRANKIVTHNDSTVVLKEIFVDSSGALQSEGHRGLNF